jgi:hypothetical protein
MRHHGKVYTARFSRFSSPEEWYVFRCLFGPITASHAVYHSSVCTSGA